MPRKPVRRCTQCRAQLPANAGPNRRYCDSACRSRHWRRVQRHNEIYRRAVEEALDVIQGGGILWSQGRCPVCGVSVSVRKRTDSVYCSPKCRTRAWRIRREKAVSGS
ncbi:hypothetical protein ABVB69_32270 [Streptomyces sp. NPDC000349]|uniref:hypothetical protein n=1 Tax=unclassified Streptomyces TaxID=2593676 RepID=UPI002787F8CE|nr:hypothetical protein [Streptomyces sp. DSM 40167]MDQ0408871.1 hypothetical protein [Streptomyces sp. DSM 40167]